MRRITLIAAMYLLFGLGWSQVADTSLQISQGDTVEGKIFRVVERMPRFPGCEHLNTNDQEKRECSTQKLYEYIDSNLRYPEDAMRLGVEGTCVVTFTVETNGKLTDIVIYREVHPSIDKEALRLVASMNEMEESWVPGTQRGKPTGVSFVLPISFELDE
jgi:TonB family protein